ncbi:MAG TPA: response regulator [Myxococcota bacterium]|nr:response regulator [Myxococcota bacterium]
MARILIVDDDTDILMLEEKVLTREGHEVQTVTSGEGALAAIKGREFDLILLDIMMPGIDGFEVSRLVKNEAQGKSTPVIFVTARDDSDSMREGFRSGGTVFLSKPFTANQLVRVVNSIIRG